MKEGPSRPDGFRHRDHQKNRVLFQFSGRCCGHSVCFWGRKEGGVSGPLEPIQVWHNQGGLVKENLAVFTNCNVRISQVVFLFLVLGPSLRANTFRNRLNTSVLFRHNEPAQNG